ncbi:MAG: polyphosphate:AMP phosphotransferase [Cyanobacteriota bacterium]|nr:polyphosphate:AMP phosphotransferase [Cyanobacteriota bacterium]
MLDTLDLELSLDKNSYKSQLETCMMKLRQLQNACWEKKLPAIFVLDGWTATGKGTLLKNMVGYMDPRGFVVHPIWPPTPEEQQYPFLWRFWQKLPSVGQVSVFYHSWYTRVLEDRLFDRISEAEIPTAMRQINAFERQMVDDGCAIAKFWLHLSCKELKKRLKKADDDPLDSWRVRPEDWQQVEHYEQYRGFAEEAIAQTSTGPAPWTLVEAHDARWAQIKVFTQAIATLSAALDRQHPQIPTQIPTPPAQEHLDPTEPNYLAQVDLQQQLSKEEYKQQLKNAQIDLRKLQMKIDREQIPVLAIFEGWDAGGKGGAIKRLTDVLDPRTYQVTAFAAPTDEEKAHHYLWRFWRQLPKAGKIRIFDRSWYGRVLVERVEGFATPTQWQRAYQEINEFEEQLTSAGYVLVKFWLHISPEEQLQRFRDRQNNPFKAYKLTDEDWRNREQWSLYEVAVNQAIQRTNTPYTPWTVVPANNKYYARVKAIETVIEAIENAL